ncbi:DUF2892 domain-containing protein [Maribacter sp. MMG018]|uniref:YgaP family membrane protein n=1 Tax=Maribacter sp. MMG018 TaxID=2822688 RepID=UPI001B3624E8|nr:DUF2892 domain-containing protein [Maribacter sp. MMG018]MBQ4914685.1 DUF2892 domain-containing protein [Maribacter sp. MMG018]
MKKNMSGTDRIVRISLALVVIILYYLKIIDGTLGNILIALSAILLFTTLIKFCPLYSVLGIKSDKNKE